MGPLTAGIEIGGTKTVVLIARGRDIVAQQRIATTTPVATLAACRAAIAGWAEHGVPVALGIGSFGPLDIAAGRITNTPKPGWADTDVVAAFAELGVPVAFDTDVNAAALAEHRWGAAVGTGVSVYMTIGTGIGAGVVLDGRPLHGLVHPEIGHVRVAAGDGFAGICPFHGDCLEGLASGLAIAARTGQDAATLGADHPVWALVADEIGAVLAMLLLTLSAERIVLGGGVGQGQPQLLPLIRAAIARRLNGYVAAVSPATLNTIVCAPGLGELSGPLGAIALSGNQLQKSGIAINAAV